MKKTTKKKKSTKKKVSNATRKKISLALKKYRKKKSLQEKRLHRKRSAAAKKGWETRRKHEREQAEEEPELVVKVLFDGHAEDPPVEHFWSNIRFLIGTSISNQLARIPAEEGTLQASFRITDAEDFSQRMEEGEELDEFGAGEPVDNEWETETDPDAFWSTYFDHARTLLPEKPDGGSDGNKSLLVVKLVFSYAPGQVSTD